MSPNPEPVKILQFYSKDIFRDFKVEDLPVYIIRVEIKVHRNQHSGTDNPVFIEIGKSTSKYFLNKGGNDFESDTKNFFSLIPKGVSKVSDLTRLKIGKIGDDQLCLRWVKLYINGSSKSIFERYFSRSVGMILDGTDSITLSKDDLEGCIAGKTTDCRGRLPKFQVNIVDKEVKFIDEFKIKEKHFEELIEVLVGDAIHNTKLYWGGKDGEKYVGSWHKSGSRSIIHTTLDLKYSTKDYESNPTENLFSIGDLIEDILPDPELDYSFDTKISCSESEKKIRFKCSRQNFGGDVITDIYSTLYRIVDGVLFDSLDDLDELLTNAMSKLLFDLTIDLPAQGLPGFNFVFTCPKIHVTDLGSIKFIWT